MTYLAINLADKLALFNDTWAPRVVGELNDYQLKLVHLEGEFVWHSHADTDELFLVIAGCLTMEFRDSTTHLGAGELLVVPRGVEHRPVADGRCQVMIIEPRGVVNTGDGDSALRADNDVWV